MKVNKCRTDEKLIFNTLTANSEELKSGEFTSTNMNQLLASTHASPLRELTILNEAGLSINKTKRTETVYFSEEARRVFDTEGNFKGLILEHLVPMKVILSVLIDLTINDKLTIESIREVVSQSELAYVTETESKLIDSQYKSEMPAGWEIGDDPLIRASVVSIDLTK